MNEENKDRPHQTRHEQSQDKSVKVGDGGSGSSSHSEIHDRIGLLLAICAFGFALMSVGMEVNRSLSAGDMQHLQEQVVDAKIKTAMADARASMQQQIAEAKAMAHASDTNSRIAIDNVQQLQVQLAAKGIKVTIN